MKYTRILFPMFLSILSFTEYLIENNIITTKKYLCLYCKNLVKCARCKCLLKWYCQRRCQKKDWKREHRYICIYYSK